MENIDDLKQSDNSISIDLTGKSNNTPTSTQKVVLGSPVNKKTIVKPKGSSSNSSDDRVVFDLTQLPEEKDPNIHESPVKDILEGPESIFGQYVENKTKEFKEWAEDYKAEEALKEEEVEDTPTTTTENGEEVEEDPLTSALKEYDDEEKEKVNLNIMEDEIFDDIDTDIEVEDIADTIAESIEEELTPDFVEEEEATVIDDTPETPEPVKTEAAKKEEKKKVEVDKSDIVLDDNTSESLNKDILVLEEEEEDSPTDEREEIIAHLKEQVTERLKPVSKKLDLSSFTIVKKPTSNTSFLQQQNVKVAKWVLPGQKSIVHMKEFLGSELELLRQYSEEASSSLASITRRFRMIYDHIASPKPSTYEAWIKSTPYSDIDHYFFAIYIACYKGANFVPKDCDKCKETFLTDDLPIMDMVKFADEKAKANFQKIYQNESVVSNKEGLYVTEVVPLSDNIAVAFKEPSIYSLVEVASLDDRFKERYANTIQYIPYIDSLYIIDQSNQQLIPIGYKGYADNAVKTIKSKIQKFNTVLNTLPSDQFGPIKSYIAAIEDREEGISYIFPSVTCPKCGAVSEESPISAEEMVFTRYQLGNLVTTSLK